MITRLVRISACLYTGALVWLTLGPASFRPETVMPPYLEHVAAFGVSGLLFSIGCRFRGQYLVFLGGAFAAFLEILQIWAPGRHARLIDFAMDTLGFSIGVAMGRHALGFRRDRVRVNSTTVVSKHLNPTKGSRLRFSE